MTRFDPTARALWLLERGGLRAEAEIVTCPIGLWLRVWENGSVFAFGQIVKHDDEHSLMIEAEEQRRGYARRGFVPSQRH